MIVKNEEALLPLCLKSIREWVDEIIILDTGSSDRTVETAKTYGARVEHFKWVDDFSAARNKALSFVRTPWTLWLDADDLALNPQALKEDCEFARRKRLSGLWCRYKQDESSYQRRLQVFKTKDFTWQGFVHENPIPKRPNITETMYSDFTVLHRKPHERRPEAALKYLKILQEKDPENWFGIAESYRFLAVHPDDPANVSLYKQNAEELFYRAAQYPSVDSATKFIALLYCGKLNLELAGEAKDTQRLEHALRLLQICHRLEPERAEPVTLLGMVYEALQEFKAAESCYEHALELPLYDRVGLVLQDYYRAIPQARLEGLKNALRKV
jgi:glycosyltransferase involved in cell wall biosynthesis